MSACPAFFEGRLPPKGAVWEAGNFEARMLFPSVTDELQKPPTDYWRTRVMSAQEKTTDCPPPLLQDARRIKTRATAEAWGKKGHSYKRVATRFRRDGFEFRQIAREGEAAIYEQTWSGCAEPSVCYEVIRIRRRDGFQIDGRLVEPAEVYPSSGAWGVDGFTLTDRDAAFAKLREVVARC